MCPCAICANSHKQSRTSVREHLIGPQRGFLIGYRQLVFYGEMPTTSSSTTEHDMDELIHDVFGVHSMEELTFGEAERNQKVGESSNLEKTQFFQLGKDNEEMLNPNCKKYSKLSFIVHFYRIKVPSWME